MDTSPTPRPLTYDENAHRKPPFSASPRTLVDARCSTHLCPAHAGSGQEAAADGFVARGPMPTAIVTSCRQRDHQLDARPLPSLAPLTARPNRTTPIRARSTASHKRCRTDDRDQVARSRLSTRPRHLRRVRTSQHSAGSFQSTSGRQIIHSLIAPARPSSST